MKPTKPNSKPKRPGHPRAVPKPAAERFIGELKDRIDEFNALASLGLPYPQHLPYSTFSVTGPWGGGRARAQMRLGRAEVLFTFREGFDPYECAEEARGPARLVDDFDASVVQTVRIRLLPSEPAQEGPQA